MMNTEKLYLATVNVPGYLPMGDELPTFDTAQEAWSYLCDERERDEENGDDEDNYSITRETLACLATPTSGIPEVASCMVDARTLCGTVYGPTPGCNGDHDLGLAYSVDVIEHVSYPHAAGYLYDCLACENGPCVCSVDPERSAPCVSSNCERSE